MVINSRRLFAHAALVLTFAYIIVNCAGYGVHYYPRRRGPELFQFKCVSGARERISGARVCDGVADCADASDETIMCRQISCPDFAYRCTYGACVDGDARCNNVIECFDGSDEIGCTYNTSTSNCGRDFTCKDGECISEYLVCDGARSCRDGSDETLAACYPTVCPKFAFQCQYGACVTGNAPCNGIRECADGSDEAVEMCSSQTHTPRPPQRDGCVVPEQPVHGRFQEMLKSVVLYPGQVVPDGTILVFSCQNNYGLSSMQTTDNVFCYNKKWNKVFPTCIRTCPKRESHALLTRCEYDGADVDCGAPMLEGARVTMSCRRPDGSADEDARSSLSVCRSGVWDNSVLQCVRDDAKDIHIYLTVDVQSPAQTKQYHLTLNRPV